MRNRFVVAMAALALLATACVNYVPFDLAANGDDPDRNTFAWSLSADGGYGVFLSIASNLGADPNGAVQVWRRDLLTGATELVSGAACGAPPCDGADASSRSPHISADGRFVVFESDATNLTAAGNASGYAAVYLVDMQTGAIVALSADGGDSTEPTISANGLKVAFTSENPNLVAGDTNGVADAFVYTVFPAGVERVSVGAAGLQSDGASSQALISGDGTVVAFHSAATNLGDPNGDSFYRHVGGTTSAFFADPPDTAANEWLSTLRDIDYDGDRFAFQRIVSTFDCTIIGCFWLDSPAVRYIDATGAPLINAAAIPPAAPGDSYLGLPMARPYFSSVDMLPQISDDGMVGSFVAAKTNFAFDFALYATDLDGSVPTLASDQPDDNVLHVAMSGDADILAVSTHPTWVIATSGRVSGRLAVAPTVSGVVADGPVVAGATVNMTVSGANFGETLLLLNSFGGFLSNVVVVDESTATGVLTIPAATAPGSYDIGALVSRLGLLGQGVCEGCLIVG